MRPVDVRDHPRGVRIRGMGHYVPDRVVDNHELAARVDTSDEWIRQKIGIEERRVCTPDQTPADIGLIAAHRALADAGLQASAIDLLVMTTLQPDHLDPMPCSQLAHQLGATAAAAFNLAVGGCPDSVFSLVTAAQYVLTGACERVLLVNAEVTTRLIDPSDRTTCVFFGDAAASWVLEAAPGGTGLAGFMLANDGSGFDAAHIPGGGSRMPYEPRMADRMRYLRMDGRAIMSFATRVFPSSVETLLEHLGLSVTDVSLFLSHQANWHIIQRSLDTLGVGMDRTYTNIHKYGNTSSASLGMAVHEAQELGLLRDGDLITMSSFGAGLAWGSVVWRWG